MKPRFRAFTPTFYAIRIFDIPLTEVFLRGYRHLFIDLDNTLAAYYEMQPSALTLAFLRACDHAGFTVTITSNNKEKRVAPFALACQVPYVANLGKPFSRKILKYCEEKGYAKDRIMVIGDQLLTDVLFANRLGFASLFVEKLVNVDHWPTRLNRLIETPIKRYLFKKGLLKPLEESV
jgi:uncharacterized protein